MYTISDFANLENLPCTCQQFWSVLQGGRERRKKGGREGEKEGG